MDVPRREWRWGSRGVDTLRGVGTSALSRTGPGPDYYYLPMAPAQWQPRDQVRVIVKSFYEQPTTLNGSADHPNRLRGILRRGVDGFPLQSLKQRLNVSDSAWMLDETMDPDSERQLGLMLMGGLSFFGAVLIGAAHLFARRRRA